MSVPFAIRSAGRCFEGRYRIEGRHIEVVTPYGMRRAALGLHHPLKLAKSLYRVILRDVSRASSLPLAAIDDASHSARMSDRPERPHANR